MRPLLACLLLTLALPASAQIYKYIDANGNTVFTNQPPDGSAAESVTLPPTNTMQAPTTASDNQGSETESSEAQAPYNLLRLIGIPDEEAIRSNNGSFIVSVEIQPRLQPGHLLRLILDGQPYGQASNVTSLQVTEIGRGEHSLAVAVMQGERIIQQSPSEAFSVQRISVNSPARQPATPPKPTPKPAN
ncbi:DUF4124 domain-containing protein [Pseudomonas sp. NCCP-436]|uniref:DUF4124 domain-containing protein n=1 Tax=Pseudomonas sp. NCCP-436 TaxID=2842481 RepID=UPI001C81050F|nr:DUF4124 domain-containing protein [Pseudomonas sp. NCCP-436]GIZ12598.1 hypothetical protein NCCP436_20140 [Pseudomonas sp. NCCP-436]